MNDPKMTIEVAIKFIPELIRLHDKLREGGFSDVTLTEETTSKIVDDRLEYRYKLKAGDTILASIIQVDNRSLEEIKAAKEADKTKLQEQADADKAKIDEILAVVDAKTKL